MRRGIDGLAAIIQQNHQLDPYAENLFLFCGKRRDRLKALLWEGDGFVLLYKRLNGGSYQWPRQPEQARSLTREEFTWLMQGLSVDQPKAIRPSKPKDLV
jgi:transposase